MYGSEIVITDSFVRHMRDALAFSSLLRVWPNPHGSRLRKTTYFTPNGKRECARRVRQIAAGSLKVENGLSKSGVVLSPKDNSFRFSEAA